MAKTLSLMLAAALVALAAGPAPAATARMTADPEKKVLERSGYTFIGYSDGLLIFMKDVPGASNGVHRVITAYESLTPLEHEGFAFRSVESLGEFDCAKGRTRVLRETFYEKPSLQGQTAGAPEKLDAEWADGVAGQVGLLRVAFACRDRPLA